MDIFKPFKLLVLCFVGFTISAYAEIYTYNWPTSSALYNNAKYDIRVRTYNQGKQSYGNWVDLHEFYSFQRSYADHWKVGGDAGSDFMADRSLTYVSFAFTGIIEMEVTQKLSSEKALKVDISPKAFGYTPNYFNGKTVRFIMDSQDYVSVFFNFGSNDKSINRDDNRANGYDIKHGCMIFCDEPETSTSNEYSVPKPTDNGVVVWDNNTDLATILNANIIYFPPGEHEMRNHKDRWERNSSWDKSEAAGNWVTTESQYKNAALYRGRLNLSKDNQKVYLAPGAIVYGGFHSNGKDNNWLYGRGIITGRKHLMHEIVKPDGAIAETNAYQLVTKTKEAFCDFGEGAVYDGIIFLEAWHHTCPSGKNTTIKHTKIIGWCSNNDGIRPGSGSNIDKIFIKTSDDYDYARDNHTVRNAVMWPGVNGAVGQLGWNNLGSGNAKYYNMYVINSEWHESDLSKGNVGIMNGGMADAGIKLTGNIMQDIYIENRTNFLAAVKLSGTGTGYLRNFLFKNITTEYPFSNPAGITVKQELRGTSNTWVEGWTFTNLFVDGTLITWENHKNYFNVNLSGTNGSNIDESYKCKNITFNSEGTIYNINYTKSVGGEIRPKGSNGIIQIAEGMNQYVSILPNDGYRIKSITVDGILEYQYGNNAYPYRKQTLPFKSISANHSLDVEFESGSDFFDLSGTFVSPPEISFYEPSADFIIYPDSDLKVVTLNANTTDGSIIKHVELYINNELVGTDSVAPYQWTSADFALLQTLQEGQYTLKGIATSNNDRNSQTLLQFSVISPPSHIRIEAEDYSAMYDIKTEGTGDTGGGSNIGYINNGKWSEYTVDVPKEGIYSAIFRVASDLNGGTIRIKIGDTILKEINIETTGGWQTWVTTNVIEIQLPAGLQTIRLEYVNTRTSGFLFNLNWWEIDYMRGTPISDLKIIHKLKAYPNPATDNIVIDLPIKSNNPVQILSLNGQCVSTKYIPNNQIPVGELPKGDYILKITVAGRTYQCKFAKL